MKSEIRNPKPTRDGGVRQRGKPQSATEGFRISDFGFLSDFGLRISDFIRHSPSEFGLNSYDE